IQVAGEVGEDFRLRLGGVTIRSIKTPWHTPGSVCYAVEEDDITTLIAGDTLYGFYFLNRSKDIFRDMQLGKESLQRIRESEYNYLAIGHAMKGFKGDVQTRLEEAQRQYASRDFSEMIAEQEVRPPMYIDPWHKRSDQYFKY
nr:hypothetical protein [bacterium]